MTAHVQLERMLKRKIRALQKRKLEPARTHAEILDFLALYDLKNYIRRVTKEKVDF